MGVSQQERESFYSILLISASPSCHRAASNGKCHGRPRSQPADASTKKRTACARIPRRAYAGRQVGGRGRHVPSHHPHPGGDATISGRRQDAPQPNNDAGERFLAAFGSDTPPPPRPDQATTEPALEPPNVEPVRERATCESPDEAPVTDDESFAPEPHASTPPEASTKSNGSGQRHTEDAPRHNKAVAADYLTGLDSNATRFTFQFFSDDKKSKGYAEIFHGTLDEVWPKVLALKLQRGIGVFVTVCATDFRGRATRNIVRARALFADADGEEQVANCTNAIKTYDAKPSMAVITGRGLHPYYFCNDIPLDQFSALQKSLSAKLGTDPTVHDLPRVMRLPGTLHLKDPVNPRLVELHRPSGAIKVWKLADLIEKLGLSTEAVKPDPQQNVFAGTEHPLLSFPPIKEGCPWLRDVHDTGGADQSEVLWRDALRVSGFLEGGETLRHEFSNKHAGYDFADTEAKYERAREAKEGKDLGWPLCRTIHDHGSKHCATCPHWGQINSPLALAWQQWEQERRARQIAENIKIGDDVTEPLLPQIMTLAEMSRRLVFIGSIGAVADLKTGRVRKKEHATDEYAASWHTYIAANGKPKTEPALKLWIASRDRMTVEVLAWVPGSPQICQPPEGQGPAFNMWRGLPPMAYPEDWQERVQPFLEHIEFLVPVAGERERFLQWLAHIIQVPEVLPHTSYLMITPTTGIGRNLLASILVRVLRGFVAAGVSLPDILDGGFTGRLGEKLLVIVDEAREGSGERRYQRATRLTSLLNEEHREVNPKYGLRSIQKNCARWLMFSNYDDAIPFDSPDRRIIVIFNPTIRKEDAYYERLYGLLNDHAFIGSVRHWLETKDITAFRPGEHAPMNEAKLRILGEMMNETERAVAEFKEDCETELTSRNAIKKYVESNTRPITNDTHLTHAIRRAGMVSTGRRIRAFVNRYEEVTEQRFSVVIVRGGWTIEIVKKADPKKLLEAMGLKDWRAMKS